MPLTEDKLATLNSIEWRDLHDCASRLDRALLTGAAAVDLLQFLPPPEAPHRRAVLHELIKIELEARYRRGQKCLVDEFCRCYPELGALENLSVGLLYEEYRVRRMYGEVPALEEYRARFPRQFEQLRQLVGTAPALEAPLPTTLTPVHLLAEGREPSVDKRGQSTKAGNGRFAVPGSAPLANGRDVVLSGGQGYQKLARLGKGEFGEVWRARAPGGVEVAIKIILRTLDHEASQRELKALEKICQLRHPFLLQTHQFQSEQDHLVIVMELADGSLSDHFKACKAQGLSGIPVEELVTYFGQAADALDYLHSEHVSHRDIKPQNLLMLHGYAKVADFGLAREQDQPMDEATEVCGTPHFMAPEVWRKQISRHSDQYSLAATYVQMRLGRPLFPGKTHYEIAHQHVTCQPNLDPLPEAEQAVLRPALAKEPDQRFPSCAAFAQALKEATAPAKPPIVPPVPVAPDRSWSTRIMVAALALALTAALAVLGIVLSRPPPKSEPESKVSWQPRGWEPEDNKAPPIEDRNGHHYYRRLVRTVGLPRVVMVAVPQTAPSDPPTFYIMENKLWNDLYAVFMAAPEAERLLQKYKNLPGCERLVRGDWRKGGFAPNLSDDPDKEPFLGVEGPVKGRLPVFRVTVTEAHCFAEWLAGRLPTQRQWRRAAGWGEDSRPGPFDGDPLDPSELAVGPLSDGPRPVAWGNRDVSLYGCRQMASNGYEWTRDLADKVVPGEAVEIPLDRMNATRRVFRMGQSYLDSKPLTFQAMTLPALEGCTTASYEVTFRVVLEQ